MEDPPRSQQTAKKDPALALAVSPERPAPPPEATTGQPDPGGLEPRLVAAIDLGSQALRMTVGEFIVGRPIRRLETLTAPVAIGLDTFSRGRIRAVTTEAVVRTLGDFLQVIRGYGLEAEDCRTVATTAVRDAGNREVFTERVARATGLQVTVIEAIEEARLLHRYVQHQLGPAFAEGTQLLLALGAGGTHLVIQTKGEIVVAETMSIGLMRLMQSGVSEKGALRLVPAFMRKVVGPIGRAHDLPPANVLVVINSELRRLVEGLIRSKQREWGLQVTRKAFKELSKAVRGTSTEDIVEQTRLDHGTAGMARMAFEELRVFADLVGGEPKVVFPDASMLDSVLLEMRSEIAWRLAGEVDPGPDLVESAAWALGRKYRIDEEHAGKVRELALQLFDGLRRFTTLADRSRLLLAVGAILHDLGVFVAGQDHERHSAYLIRASQIMGLSREEVEKVALLARFHRAELPPTDSVVVSQLSSSSRVELLKLAALLRVADALDADHEQRVDSVSVEMTDEALEVRAETRTGDRESFTTIRRAFKSKSNLCEELFGVEARLTEVLAT